MPAVGAGVVEDALQREVDPLGGEERQRIGLAGLRQVRAVGDRVVDLGQVRQLEHRLHRLQVAAGQICRRLLDDKGQRDAPVADADIDRHLVMAQQEVDLLPVVVGEEIRPRQRRAIAAGIGQAAIGRSPVRQHVVGPDGHPEIGIAGLARVVAEALAGEEAGEARLDLLPPRLVDLGNRRHGRRRIGEAPQLARPAMGVLIHGPSIAENRSLDNGRTGTCLPLRPSFRPSPCGRGYGEGTRAAARKRIRRGA
jgi:hypothetical protein